MTRAFLISPLVAPALFFLGYIVFVDGPNYEVDDLFVLLVISLVFASPVSYLASLIFGYPYIKILKRFDLLSTLSITLGGVFFGAISFIAFWGFFWDLNFLLSSSLGDLAHMAGIGAVLGGGVSFCFACLTKPASDNTRL